MARVDLSPHDFYNPFMAAAIVDSAGRRVPLWTRANAQGGLINFDGQALDNRLFEKLESFPYLQELQVQTNLGNYPIIKAVLTPPYAEGIAFLDSPLSEWGKSSIEVQLGYIFGPSNIAARSPVWRGVLLKPDIAIGTEIKITLNAQGVGAFRMDRQEGALTRTDTRRNILIALEAKHNQGPGEDIRIDDDSLVNALLDPVAGPELNKEITFSQGFRTDLEAFWDVVRESQCWMTFEGNKIKIIPRGEGFRAEPKADLSLFGSVNGELGPEVRTFPILNITSPTMAVYLPATTLGLRLEGIDSRTAQEKRDDVNPDDLPAVGPAQGQNKSDQLPENPDNVPAYIADPNNPRAKQQAFQELQKSRTSMGVRLEIDTLGIPDITPGDVVRVSGAGRRLAGTYGVFNVTHVYGPGGLTTSLSLVSNTSPLFTSGTEIAQKLNTQEVEKRRRGNRAATAKSAT